MAFVAPDSETDVLASVARHVSPDGAVVVGFHVDKLDLDTFDRAVDAAALEVENRFATWDLKGWHDDADFAVTVLRHRAPGRSAAS